MAYPDRALHADPLAVIAAARAHFGYLNDRQVSILAEDPDYRQTQCLVRCGGRRFACAAQDVECMIRAIKLDGDYVRDVSLPVPR